MRVASRDRAEVLNAAGAGHLSPAVRDGVPLLAPEGDGAGRVGWADFFAALDAAGQAALAGDLLGLIHQLNRSGDSTMVVPGEYLEVVVARR